MVLRSPGRSLVLGVSSLGLLGAVACAPPAQPAAGESPKAAAEDAAVDCKGSFGKTPAPDGRYHMTSFGCWVDEAGNHHGDPGDNCVPACLADAQASICSGLGGKACEETVAWYAADAARFGCMARLLVTNPATGAQVVVVALDKGPSCKLERGANHALLDLSVPASKHLFGEVKGYKEKALVTVEVVPAETPLGPVVAPPATAAGTGGAGGAGGANGAGGSE